jgi:hypothetical protein
VELDGKPKRHYRWHKGAIKPGHSNGLYDVEQNQLRHKLPLGDDPKGARHSLPPRPCEDASGHYSDFEDYYTKALSLIASNKVEGVDLA